MKDIYEYLYEILKDNIELTQDALQKKSSRFWSACSKEYDLLSEKLDDKMSRDAFALIINEILLQQMHSLLVAIDGGAWISEKYQFDIVNIEDDTIVNEEEALHEQFFDYLWDQRAGDPFENL